MNQDHYAQDDNEDNILKAFEQGAHDIINQKRDPNDFIDFDNPSAAPSKQSQHQINNKISKYGGNEQNSKQEKIVIGFDEDDDDFTGNYQQNNQQNQHGNNNTQNRYGVNNHQAHPNQNNEDDDQNDNGFANNNLKDNQMFINRDELVGTNQYVGTGQVISKPAGIYLDKDDDLEKLKEYYEGQEKEKVEQTNKQFAMNRQAQEKKKKQLQDQKKQKENNNNAEDSNIAKLTKNDFKYDKKNKIKNLINDEEELGEIGEWIEKTANANKKKKDDGFDDEDEHSNNGDDDFDFDDAPPQKGNNQAMKQPEQNKNNIIAEDDDDENEEQWNEPNKQKDNVHNIISQEVQQQKKKEEQEIMKQKQDLVNKKLQQQQILKHKNGPIANRLQDKAKFMELTNVNKDSTQIGDKQTSENNIQRTQNENEVQNDEEFKEDNKEEEDDGVDWEKINQHAKQQYQNNQGQSSNQQNKVINFMEAWSNLKGQNLQELKKQIVTNTSEKKSFSFFDYLNSFCGVVTPNINSAELLNERDQIFAIAKMQYSEDDNLHFQMLYSIFCNLTKNQNCPRVGSHWEQIGFQGKQPSTDLRGTGILGVLQMLAMVTSYKDFLIEALEYSHDPVHSFPLCVTLINVTDIVLQTCREQKLNALINKERSVISVFNNVYFAAFYMLFTQYKSKQMTVNLFGDLRKSVEVAVKSNPKKCVDEFKVAIQQYYKNRE